MKKNIYLLFILTVFTTFSCKKLLEEQPYSSLTVAFFFNNYTEANQAVIGAYSLLSGVDYYKRSFTNITGFTSDDSYHKGAAFTPFDDGSLEPTNPLVTSLWNTIFSLNGKINFTIQALENAPSLTNAEKTKLIGRLQFLRSLNLFNAVRLWGDVPMVTEYVVSDENLYPARTPKAQVYAFIEDQLYKAATTLPVTETEYGFPTKGAAQSLLAKVFLTEEKWTNANNLLDTVIASNTYSLLPNYMDVFDITKENNAEEIFSIQFKKDESEAGESSLGSLLPFWFLPVNNNLGYTADGSQTPGQMRTEHASYDRYTAGDYASDGRKNIFITTYPLTSGTTFRRYPDNPAKGAQGPAVSKYRDPSNNFERNYDNNLYILRYADVLLMKAEAENEVNGPTIAAFNAFNQVRLRSNTVPLSAATILTKDAFRDAVSNERGLEFFGEFQRYFDQIRMKKPGGDSYYKFLKEKVKADGKFATFVDVNYLDYYPKYELMPIPASEIAINPNITASNQNPGY
ncbi:MAG: RagB/SusD family nutrient uptake outer membrane protein [Niabella sp.]